MTKTIAMIWRAVGTRLTVLLKRGAGCALAGKFRIIDSRQHSRQQRHLYAGVLIQYRFTA